MYFNTRLNLEIKLDSNQVANQDMIQCSDTNTKLRHGSLATNLFALNTVKW